MIERDRDLKRKFKILLYNMINVEEIINWLKDFGGSFVREEPLIVGFVNR